jgi:hypothetical protein
MFTESSVEDSWSSHVAGSFEEVVTALVASRRHRSVGIGVLSIGLIYDDPD